jgi:hypothetical protein
MQESPAFRANGGPITVTPEAQDAGDEQFSVMGENVTGIVLSVCPVLVIKDTSPESDCAL